MIPFKVLPIGEKEIQAVTDVLKSKNIGMGKIVKQFEDEIAEYTGAKYAVAVDSCTSALYLSLQYKAKDNVGFLPVQSVRIPSMTVPLVANTITHCKGAGIHFIDECDWVGHSYEIQPYGIIDSAHEVSKDQFKRYKDNDLLCYSFYPTKPITSCEGGMIITNDEKAVEWIRKARYYGRNSGSSIARNSWEYDIEFPGWKMNMTEVQAALGLEQLRRLPELDARRKEVVDAYNELLGENNTSLYLYRINVNNRDEFIRYMYVNGVECGVHFRPLHLMTPFKNCKKDDLSKTEANGKTTVSLPLYDSLSEQELLKVVNLVTNWRKNNG